MEESTAKLITTEREKHGRISDKEASKDGLDGMSNELCRSGRVQVVSFHSNGSVVRSSGVESREDVKWNRVWNEEVKEVGGMITSTMMCDRWCTIH